MGPNKQASKQTNKKAVAVFFFLLFFIKGRRRTINQTRGKEKKK